MGVVVEVLRSRLMSSGLMDEFMGCSVGLKEWVWRSTRLDLAAFVGEHDLDAAVHLAAGGGGVAAHG